MLIPYLLWAADAAQYIILIFVILINLIKVIFLNYVLKIVKNNSILLTKQYRVVFYKVVTIAYIYFAIFI